MKCPVTGKEAHASRELAEAHQKALVYRNHLAGETARSAGLNVYPCQHCSAWHVGHTETAKIPLVYHYTIGRYLDKILEDGALKPRSSRAVSLAINEPNPLLWFSWNQEWEHSVIKDPRPREFRHSPPTGRAITEMAGQGLLRFGASPSVARLRWDDYLARNVTPAIQRDAMSQRGYPPDWLATDQRVCLTDCKVIEVWYQGQWVNGELLGDEFDDYLAGRVDAYEVAWHSFIEKVFEMEKTASIDALRDVLDPDAERILFEDYMVKMREDEWKQDHLSEIQAFVRTLPKKPVKRKRRR